MKKLIAIATVAALALALAACAPGTLKVASDDDGVHAVATNGAEGAANGNITINEGFGLCVNHIVEKGSFHVKATDASGAVVFDEDITDNIANMVPANGEIEVVISAKGATGTVDVIAYDEAAQAQADSTLPRALAQAGTTASAVGISNPWTLADSAQAAADGAGMGAFQLPESGITLEGAPLTWSSYQYTEGLAEADGNIGTSELMVRKGRESAETDVAGGVRDVSGDDTAYARTWTVNAGDAQVTCYGNEEGRAMKATWTSNGFSYSIVVRGQGDPSDTTGLSTETVAALASSIA